MEDKVQVMVKFEAGRVRPLWFMWRGRDYQVRGWPMSWERKNGGRRYLCFAVDCGGMMAELAMDRENLQFSIRNFQPEL